MAPSALALACDRARILGKTTLRARQCSPRGGDLNITVHADSGRVTLAGTAFVVLNGELLLR